MNAIAPPNYTQTPNVLFDELMQEMSDAELRVVLAAIRKIFGWHKNTPEPISISQFMKLTGMSNRGVLIGIDAAIKRGILLEAGRGARGVSLYTLNISEPATSERSSQVPMNGVHKSTPPTSEQGSHTKERGNKGKKPAAQTQNPTPRDLMVEAYWEGVDGFGTAPRYLLQDAAELIEMGATVDEVRQMAAEKQAARGAGADRYELRWLVEDWPDWMREQRRKAADRAEVERGRRQMEQHRAAMREARGSDQ